MRNMSAASVKSSPAEQHHFSTPLRGRPSEVAAAAAAASSQLAQPWWQRALAAITPRSATSSASHDAASDEYLTQSVPASQSRKRRRSEDGELDERVAKHPQPSAPAPRSACVSMSYETYHSLCQSMKKDVRAAVCVVSPADASSPAGHSVLLLPSPSAATAEESEGVEGDDLEALHALRAAVGTAHNPIDLTRPTPVEPPARPQPVMESMPALSSPPAVFTPSVAPAQAVVVEQPALEPEAERVRRMLYAALGGQVATAAAPVPVQQTASASTAAAEYMTMSTDALSDRMGWLLLGGKQVRTRVAATAAAAAVIVPQPQSPAPPAPAPPQSHVLAPVPQPALPLLAPAVYVHEPMHEQPAAVVLPPVPTVAPAADDVILIDVDPPVVPPARDAGGIIEIDNDDDEARAAAAEEADAGAEAAIPLFPYPPLDVTTLTREQEEIVHGWLYPTGDVDLNKRLGGWKTDFVTQEKVMCLRDDVWLNDEVINFRMVKLRDDNVAAVAHALANGAGEGGNPGGVLNGYGAHGVQPTYVCTTLFYAKLAEGGAYDYSRVRRWTRRVPLDWNRIQWIIIPINISNMHWALAVVDRMRQMVHYYDSMSGARDEEEDVTQGARFQNILRWVSDDSADKLGEAHRIDTADWVAIEYPKAQVPQQADSVSCGVFMSTFAACVATGRPFKFNSKKSGLNHLRRTLVLEVLQAGPNGGKAV